MAKYGFINWSLIKKRSRKKQLQILRQIRARPDRLILVYPALGRGPDCCVPLYYYFPPKPAEPPPSYKME